MRIHPTAIIESGAELSEAVEIGPYAVVGPHVELEEGVEVGPHAVVTGHTRVGQGTRIFAHACIGGEPQHRDFSVEPTRLDIGKGNVIREHVTIHVGTAGGGRITSVGDGNLIMNSSHIGHDCRVGSYCEIAPFCGLAGHAVVEDFAVLGAYTGVHQTARVGYLAMTASGAKVSLDAPPYVLVAGDRARVRSLNSVGLKRREVPKDSIRALQKAFRLVFRSGLRFVEARSRVGQELPGVAEVERLMEFLLQSERGFCR